MKLSIALSLLSTVHANKLRGINDNNEPAKIKLLSSDDPSPGILHLTAVEQAMAALQTADDAEEFAACSAHASSSECIESCTWCESKAVSSACYPTDKVDRLPEGVFECAVSSVKTQSVQEEKEQVKKSEMFNLKSGITLTLSSDAVDNEFCDPNSASLAGYMNVKGSQFDTNNDKNLFFWMFEKRTTSLLPSKSSPALKSKWNWPCIFDCEDAPQSPASTDGATNGQASGASSDASSAAVPVDQIPLVVWLTGGPGCSSSLALLTENGPCAVNDDGKTTALNAHSWTESAHVLWLDQPANVGYSYGQDNDTNEEMISEDAYYFLQAFLQSEDGKKYKNNPLFIVGESYGGHYAPAIAHRIWRGNKDVKEGLLTLNLAGLAIGNGLTNPEIQYQYYSEMGFKNSHDLKVIEESTYNGMKKAEPICVKGIQECNNGDGMLNSFSCQAAFLGCNAALTTPFRMTGLNPYDIRKPCGDNPLCYDFSHIETFMNLPETKQKLHVDTHNPSWQTCNMAVNMEFHTDWMKDFSGYVADLLNADIPALIYAGDVDFICNYLGNKAWVTALDWNNKADFNAAEDRDWNNGAGLAKTAGKLTFLQVYDAGHMVPSDQPEHALTMITQFLNGEAF